MHAKLAPMLCLASVLLMAFARVSLAEAPCDSPALHLEDLRTLARDDARANRVAPHSLYLRDPVMRAELAAQRQPSGDDPTLMQPSNEAAAGDESWQPGFGLPGLHEYASVAIEYHGELVVAGWIRSAGQHRANGIARWTETGWEPLGTGINAGFALAILNDRLYAGDWIGGVSAWDGRSWTRLPAAPLDNLRALFVHNGALIAAGSYQSAGRVARFDGQTWQLVGGAFDAPVAALGSYRGELIAGGSFRSNQSGACGYVARWNGAAWESLGSGVDGAEYGGVSAIEEYGDRLIIGGWYWSCGGVPTRGLAAWDGSAWSALAGAPAAYVNDLLVMNGNLFVAGSFDGEYTAVERWDGATWTSEQLGQWVLGLAAYRGQLAAVGGFYGSGCPHPRMLTGVATLGPGGWSGLDRWDSSMHGLAHNAGAADVWSAVVYQGDLVVAGIIGLAGNPPEWKGISTPARWDGHAWQTLGGASCAKIVGLAGDDLIAAGNLVGQTSEGPLHGVARWDGSQWHPMGRGLDGLACAIAEYRGNVYVGGELHVTATGQPTTLAVFDGVEWRAVPSAPGTAQWNTARVSALEVKDDLLYAGGNFVGSQSVASPSVVAWDGTRWRSVGGGVVGEVLDLESYRGDLFAAGTMNREGPGYEGVLRWDGATWNSIGLERCQVLALGHYGDKLVIAGNAGVDRFVPGSLGIVSWDGVDWSGFDTGVNGQVRAIRQIGSDLYVAGCFSYAGEQSSFAIAHWSGSEPTVFPDLPGARSASPTLSSTFVTSNQARLSYSLPAAGHVRLELFDVRGARLATLRDADVAAGDNQLDWSPGSPAPFPRNGVYFLRLTAAGKTASAKVIFAR